MESYLQVNLLGPGPRLMKKRIYRAAISQKLRNPALDFNFLVYLLFTNRTRRTCRFLSFLRLRLCLGCYYYMRPQAFGNTVTDAGRSSAERHVAPLWPRCLGWGDDPAGQDPATGAILLRTQSALPTRIASQRPYWPWRPFTADKSTLKGQRGAKVQVIDLQDRVESVKANVSLVEHEGMYGVGAGIAPHILKLGTEWAWSVSRSDHFKPRGHYRRYGEEECIILPLPRFETRIYEPVVWSLYWLRYTGFPRKVKVTSLSRIIRKWLSTVLKKTRVCQVTFPFKVVNTYI